MSRWAHQGSCKRAAAGLSEFSESQTMRKKQFAKEDAANTMPCREQSPALASAKQKAARLNRIETNCDSALESGSTMALTSSAHKINRMSSKTSMRKNQQISIKLVKKGTRHALRDFSELGKIQRSRLLMIVSAVLTLSYTWMQITKDGHAAGS
jgi:hypothetical protein